MVAPGRLTAQALAAVRAAITPGITTEELDAIAERTIRAGGGVPNFAKEPGYRHAICASVNEEVVHGMPGPRVLEAGDIVSIDAGAELGGWNGDAAFTVVVPDPARPQLVAARQRLADVTERALWAGIAAFAAAEELDQVGSAIERSILRDGPYGILREYVGHGIGRSMHEDPPVFNYATGRRGAAVRPGLAVAIEPMVTAGTERTGIADDEWTVATLDGTDAAHWEHSVARHEGGIWVLTAEDGGAAGLAPFGVVPVPIA